MSTTRWQESKDTRLDTRNSNRRGNKYSGRYRSREPQMSEEREVPGQGPYATLRRRKGSSGGGQKTHPLPTDSLRVEG